MLVGEADAARDKPPESSDLKFWKKKEKKKNALKIEKKDPSKYVNNFVKESLLNFMWNWSTK